MLKKKIRELSSLFCSQNITDRHYLHSHPELSFQEFETSSYLKKQLTEMGIAWSPVANTGIVGIIAGEGSSDQVIALRADIDALPIKELNETAYRSVHNGVMHACGHDVHASSLLGTARILQHLKSEFSGTVKLLFQPAEEKYPGGAKALIKEGAMQNPRPGTVLGQHVMPELRAGKIGIKSGRYMASNDEIYMTVSGKGGHGAQPCQVIDPVVITAYILTALQQLVSRMANPLTPTVLSFGKVIANGSANIIPNEVNLEGTLRTLDEKWRMEAHRHIYKVAYGIAESMGGTCEIKIQGFPAVINHTMLTAEVKALAIDYLGKENVVDLDIWMAGEDFGEYATLADTCYYRLGVGNPEKNISAALHTPDFDIDEDPVFSISSGLMAYLALKKIGNV